MLASRVLQDNSSPLKYCFLDSHHPMSQASVNQKLPGLVYSFSILCYLLYILFYFKTHADSWTSKWSFVDDGIKENFHDEKYELENWWTTISHSLYNISTAFNRLAFLLMLNLVRRSFVFVSNVVNPLCPMLITNISKKYWLNPRYLFLTALRYSSNQLLTYIALAFSYFQLFSVNSSVELNNAHK